MTFDELRDAVNSAFRDWTVEGDPDTEEWKPLKVEIRAALQLIVIALDDGGFSAPPDWAADLAAILAQIESLDAAIEAGVSGVDAAAEDALAKLTALAASLDAAWGSVALATQDQVDAVVDALSARERDRAAEASSSALAVGEEDCLVFDFSKAAGLQVVRRTAGAVSRVAAGEVLRNTRAANMPPMVLDAAGEWVFAPTNLFLASEAPATQSVADTVAGMSYYFAVGEDDTGSLALTGAVPGGTGTVDKDNPRIVVSTGGTITATKTGTLSRMQMSYGDRAVEYLATTAAARFGLPISISPLTGKPELLLAMTSTNYFPDSPAPETQTVDLPAADWAVSVIGEGDVEVSGGRGTASEGSPVYFTLGETTSVTFTVDGAPAHVQVEPRGTVTPPIFNYGSGTATRENSIISADIEADLDLDLSDGWAAYVEWYCDAYNVAADTPAVALLSATGASGNSVSLVTDRAVNQTRLQVATDSVAQDSFGPAVSAAGVLHEAVIRLVDGGMMIAMDGLPPTAGRPGVSSANAAVMPELTTINLPGSGQYPTVHLQRLAIFPRAIKAAEICDKFRLSRIDPQPTPYVVLLGIGQSQKNSGGPYDAGIDVSHPLVDVLDLKASTPAAVLAQEPLPVYSSASTGEEDPRIGHDLALLRDHLIPGHGLPAGHRALILPVSAAGQGFGGFNNVPRFNPGNDLYNMAEAAIGWTFRKYPNAVPLAIIHFGFDNESYTGGVAPQWTADQVSAKQEEFAAALREVFGAEAPFIAGGLSAPTITTNGAGAAAIEARLATTGTRIENAAYVVTSDLPVVTGEVHFTAAAQRTIAGRLWTAIQGLYARRTYQPRPRQT